LRSFASSFAPAASSNFTGSTFPVRAAVIRAVSPPRSVALASARASSNRRTALAFPFVQASDSGVTP
jgi:hypothetical protein